MQKEFLHPNTLNISLSQAPIPRILVYYIPIQEIFEAGDMLKGPWCGLQHLLVLFGYTRCWWQFKAVSSWLFIVLLLKHQILRAYIHLQDTLQPNQTRDAPCPAEESICSFKSSSPIGHAFEGIGFGASSVGKGSASKSAASGSKFSTPGSNSLHESQNVVGLQSTDADNVSIIATSIFPCFQNYNFSRMPASEKHHKLFYPPVLSSVESFCDSIMFISANYSDMSTHALMC